MKVNFSFTNKKIYAAQIFSNILNIVSEDYEYSFLTLPTDFSITKQLRLQYPQEVPLDNFGLGADLPLANIHNVVSLNGTGFQIESFEEGLAQCIENILSTNSPTLSISVGMLKKFSLCPKDVEKLITEILKDYINIYPVFYVCFYS